jgi:hypothetical protein
MFLDVPQFTPHPFSYVTTFTNTMATLFLSCILYVSTDKVVYVRDRKKSERGMPKGVSQNFLVGTENGEDNMYML